MGCSLRRAVLVVVLGVVGATMSVVAPGTAATATTSWTSESLSLPSVPNGELADVDCRSATFCLAVGTYSTINGTRALLEVWDGTIWRQTLIVSPSGGVHLNGVSCSVRSSRCVAVGDVSTTASPPRPFLITSMGPNSAFNSRTLPLPSGVAQATLTAVDCVGANSCVAVGSGVAAGSTSEVPISYRYGTKQWTITPPVSTGMGLRGVSCVDATTCLAVGGSSLQQLDGSTWTVQPLAGTGTDEVDLSGIACTSATSCAAVGGVTTAANPSSTQPVVETSTGGSWSLASIDPTVAASNGSLADVACVSDTQCTAVGRLGNRAGTSQPLALRRGTTWTSQSVAATSADLRGVACPDSTTCVAAGSTSGTVDDGRSLGRGLPVAVGATAAAPFADQHAPAATGFVGGRFTAVSCSDAATCVAVGAVDDHAVRPTPIIERWDGTQWTLQQLPALGFGELTGVTCVSTACFAVGMLGLATPKPLVLTWNGSTWIRSVVAKPSGGTVAVGRLEAVDCATPTSCLAVGHTANVDGNPFAAALSGATWTQTPIAPVGSDTAVTLSGASCPPSATTTCRVVGVGAATSGASPHGIDLVWNGSSWATGPAVQPSSALDCDDVDTCVAVPPTDLASGGTRVPLTASRFDGTGWTAEPMPAPSTALRVDVHGVNCRAPLSCLAVGNAGNGTTKGFYIARRSSAGAWRLETVSNGPTSTDDTLYGVACPTNSRCFAVGNGPDLPVILRSPTG